MRVCSDVLLQIFADTSISGGSRTINSKVMWEKNWKKTLVNQSDTLFRMRFLSDNSFQRLSSTPKMYLLVGGVSSIAIPEAKWAWVGSKTPTKRDPPTPHTQTLTLLISVPPLKGTEWNSAAIYLAISVYANPWASYSLTRKCGASRELMRKLNTPSLLSWTWPTFKLESLSIFPAIIRRWQCNLVLYLKLDHRSKLSCSS